MSVILVKAVVAVALAGLFHILHFLYQRSEHWKAWRLSGIRLIIAFMFVFRLLPYTAIYLVGGMPGTHSDLEFFWMEAVHAARGEIVYKDFVSPYSPLFPYLLSLSVRLWHDPRAIVLMMIVVEAATLAGTYLLFRRSFDESTCTHAALMYLVSPAPLLLVVGGGQEDVWLWGFNVPMVWLLMSGHPFVAGLVAALGMLSTKAFFLLAIVLALATLRHTRAYVMGMASLAIPSVIVLWLLTGPEMFSPIGEGGAVSPPNIWFTAHAILGGTVPLGNPFLAILGVCSAALVGGVLVLRHRSIVGVSSVAAAAAWVCTFSLLIILVPQSYGNYAAIFFMPATFLAVFLRDSRALWLISCLNVLASVQTSLWFRIGMPWYIGFSFIENVWELAEYCMELAMLVCLAALAWRSAHWIAGLAVENALQQAKR